MRSTVATAIACLLGVGVSTAHDAQAAIKKETAIPAQELGLALKQLASERDIQLIYRSEVVGERETSGAAGELTVDEALAKLLAGTDLTFQYIDDRAITIVPTHRSARTSSNLPSSSGSVWQRFRLAQLGQNPTSQNNASAEISERRVTLEEVVVTAQKREERLEDVPISISVLGGVDLDRSTLQGVAEALNTVPGVMTDEDHNGMGARVRVRGVGAPGLFNGSSPIGYYLDSVPFAFVKTALVPDASPFDLDRMEVLRGPQGTLYGASSLNGVVRILTHEADLDEVEFKARVLGSSTEKGSQSYRGDMALNVPLIEGKLAARLVAGHQKMGGWVDKPNLGRDDVNDSEVNSVRLKLKAQPSDRFTAEWASWLSRTDNDGSNTSDENYERSSSILEPNTADYDMHALKLAYDFDAFSVTSSTSYLKLETWFLVDFEPFCCTNLGVDSVQNSKVLSQEILASSNGEGAWRWTLGAMYRDVTDRAEQFLIDYSLQPLGGVTFWEDQSESIAVYGELTRLLMDGRLELTGGLRWFHDQVDVHGTGTSTPEDGIIDSDSETFTKLTPRVVLTGHVNDDVILYASYSKGFRSGALQSPFLDVEVAAQPDVLTNYEVGTKGAFWNGTVSLDASVYFMDWEKTQQTIPSAIPLPDGNTSLAAIFTNGPSASGLGFDLALTLRPAQGLSVGATLSVNDLEFDADVESATGVLFRKGERLNQSPKETYGAFVNYDFPLGHAGYRGAFSASANYISEVQVSAGGVTAFSDSQLISRLGLSLIAPRNWEATIFANNLNNERGISSPQTLGVPDWDTRPRPRTFGVQLQYHFE